MSVEGGTLKATFRDPKTAALVKRQVQLINSDTEIDLLGCLPIPAPGGIYFPL